MNIIRLFILLLPGSLATPAGGGPGSDNAYVFIRKEKEISLSCREFRPDGQRTTRELRADFPVAASPLTVVGLLRNTSRGRDWMQGVDEITTLKRVSEDEWLTYILYDIPWPLNNQDCIVRYRLSNLAGGTGYQLRMTGEPACIPVKQGVDRIPHLCGFWKISDNGKGGSRVEYRIYSLQKPKFPRWATDPIIQQNLIATMAALRELAEKQTKTAQP